MVISVPFGWAQLYFYYCDSASGPIRHTNDSLYLNSSKLTLPTKVYETSPKTKISNEAYTLAEPGVLLQDTLRPIRLFTTPKGICREL